MIVYQADPLTGIFLGETVADESPLEPGIILFPRGCHAEAPPATPEGHVARWVDDAWVTEVVPKPELPIGYIAKWDRIGWAAELVPMPEIPEGRVARWVGTGWVTEIPPVAEPPELSEPPEPTRLAKADLWRRLTDAEAVQLDQSLAAAPVRLRRIFEAAAYLDVNDPDYPALRAGIAAALGEARTAIVLQPTY